MRGKISNWDAIVYAYCENSNLGQEFKLQVKFPVEFERQAEEQKQW